MTPTEAPNWYLQEWATLLGKIQASLTNELGWNKSKANLVWHGKQAYNREIVNEISAWLEIEPYELLMPPGDALQLRQLRQAAVAIAAGLPKSPDVNRTIKAPEKPRARRAA